MGKECNWYQRLERDTAVSNFGQKRSKYKEPDETISSGSFLSNQMRGIPFLFPLSYHDGNTCHPI